MFRFYIRDFIKNIKEKPLLMVFAFLCIVVSTVGAMFFYTYSMYNASAVHLADEESGLLREYNITVGEFAGCNLDKFQEHLCVYGGHVALYCDLADNLSIYAAVSTKDGFTEEELLNGTNAIILSYNFIEKVGNYDIGDKVTIVGVELTVKGIGQIMYAPLLSGLRAKFLVSANKNPTDWDIASLYLPSNYNAFQIAAVEREIGADLRLSVEMAAMLIMMGIGIVLVAICGINAGLMFLAVVKSSAYRYKIYRINGANNRNILACMALGCVLTVVAGLAAGLPLATFLIVKICGDFLSVARISAADIAVTSAVVLALIVPIMIIFSFKNFKRKVVGG